MATKKRKQGFDIPASGASDTGWVIEPRETSGHQGDPPVATEQSRSSTTTYTKGPEAPSPHGLEENKMDQSNTTPGSLLVNGVKVLGEVAVVPGACSAR